MRGYELDAAIWASEAEARQIGAAAAIGDSEGGMVHGDGCEQMVLLSCKAWKRFTVFSFQAGRSSLTAC